MKTALHEASAIVALALFIATLLVWAAFLANLLN